MSERVHPAGGDTPKHQAAAPGSPSKELHLAPPRPDEKNQPPPGTYVIQVPKEQIFRTPTPETERRFKEYTRRGRGRTRSCCCCLCWVTGVLLVLALVLAAAAGVLYLVFRPQLPRYTVQSVSVRGVNLTADATLSPEFDVVIRAENPNKKVRIHYRGGSSVVVSHSGVDFCRGSWPSFYQGTRNVTLMRTALTGSGIRLSGAMRGDLVAGQGRGEVPLEVRARVPVRVKFGAVTTWTITAKVRCDLTVDKLAASSRVVSASCGVKVKLL
ncbi:hypothetical protein Taro_002158 [Colocasia esculenta]|uniref:Late embryogenesis abundant protein LEA-2 subgroup domain-containing protein n=1 Tax=Colocasia esculenta TaxID=4460 RepID=A0A843TI16_COLES|nr:hypothetical protein [Colocasia esculenta]